MMTVLLYGALGRRFGRVHRYDVRTPREAVRAMCVTIPDFRKAFADGSWRLVAGGRHAIGMDDTAFPVSHRESLRFIPVVEGAGGGLGRTLIGASLIAASFYMPEVYLATSGPLAAMTVSSIAGSIGMSLVLSGVSQMLFSPPKQQSTESPNNRPSFSFDGAVNTAAQGNPVPVCYGTVICGSQVISAGLHAEQVAA